MEPGPMAQALERAHDLPPGTIERHAPHIHPTTVHSTFSELDALRAEAEQLTDLARALVSAPMPTDVEDAKAVEIISRHAAPLIRTALAGVEVRVRIAATKARLELLYFPANRPPHQGVPVQDQLPGDPANRAASALLEELERDVAATT